MEKPAYEKGSFTFLYPVSVVKEALDKIFDSKNDYSWSDYDSTLMLGLDLACNLAEKDGESSILLSGAESMSLGLYSKSKTKAKSKKNVDKKPKK